MKREAVKLNIKPIAQEPNECGPAALAMILKHFGREKTLREIIDGVPKNAARRRDWLYFLGSIALKEGCHCEIVTLSTQTIDPSWTGLGTGQLEGKLTLEWKFVTQIQQSKKEPYEGYFLEHHIEEEGQEIRAALEYLGLGGTLRIGPTSKELIEAQLQNGAAIIASLDSTILYQVSRGKGFEADDIEGSAWGHVVVIDGFDESNFYIVDPASWFSSQQAFAVSKDYLIEAILRRDQNILILWPAPPVSRSTIH